MKYKRYMVFKWTTYDNVQPLQCVEGSFDDANFAFLLVKNITEGEDNLDDDGEQIEFACVFDRIEGVVIE